jgi:PAS domain S-box-containing protein
VRKNTGRTSWFSPPIFLTIFIGVAISITVFSVMRSQERREAELEFKHEMEAQVNSLKREIDFHLEVLLNLKGFYEASEHVSRAEFGLFTSQALSRYPGIQALEWIPFVTAAERAEYEALAQSDGFPDFHFTQPTEQGNMIPAAEQAEYFPVYYVEPYQGNEPALGFNLASNPARLTTLTQSRESGQIVGSARIPLVQEQGEQFGFLIFVPIYNGNPATPTTRNRNLKGFLLGVYSIDGIIDNALNYAVPKSSDISLWVDDISNPADEQPLYASSPDSKIETRFDYQESIEIAGRRWRISGYPTAEFVAAHQTWQPYILLVVSLLFTGLLAVYLRQRLSELGLSKGETRAIVESVVDGIITINEQGTIKSFNPAAERIFGYESTEVINQNVNILMPEPDHSRHDSYLTNYLRTSQAKIIGIGREVTGQRKDGTTFPIDLAVSEMHIGEQSLFIGITRDITERKKAEAAIIEAKEKAEEANRLKSDFLNVISHELRTPLTVMLGNLPLLTDPDDLPQPVEIAEISQDIADSGEHLLSLINDLLDISKIEAGKMKLYLDTLVVVDSVDNVISTIEPMASQKGLTLETQIEDLLIHADAKRLKQIMLNLLSNAIKFTDEGSITVIVKAEDEHARFQIHDTGRGMKQEDLLSIFDKFQQVDSSSTRATDGTGLGLAITKKLVELHGGHINVKSELGSGSVFTFSIPLALAQEEHNV